MPTVSTTQVIDLISSDDVPEIPTSSPVQIVESRTKVSDPATVSTGAQPFDFSDEIDFLLPAPKRRRVTPPLVSPPPKVIARVGAVAQDGGATRSKEKEQARNPGSTVSQRLHIDFDDDDILATSSPALPVRASPRRPNVTTATEQVQQQNRAATQRVEDLLSEFQSSEDSPVAESVSRDIHFSQKTAALLAQIDTNRRAGQRHGNGTTNAATATAPGGSSVNFRPPGRRSGPKPTIHHSSIEDPSSPIRPSVDPTSQHTTAAAPRRQKLSTPEREQRARGKASEKEAAKAQKAAERAAAREAKAREKKLATDLAEVNRARHDKKISTGEMMVCISDTLRCLGNLHLLVDDVFKQLAVQIESIQDPMEMARAGLEAYSGVVSWKRKVRARYDEEAGHWVPVEQVEITEETSHVLCVVPAKQLVEMIQAWAKLETEAENTDNQKATERGPASPCSIMLHCVTLKQKWPGRKPIYLIEGLESYLRKSRNTRNRNYQAAVRAQQEAESAEPALAPRQQKRTRKAAAQPEVTIDDDVVEDALLELQVEHGCLIHHTASTTETAEWISNFTQHISTIPYKARQHGGGGGGGGSGVSGDHDTAAPSFCMDVGQVRTGEDKADTYAKMLGEIVRVTLPVAYGIAAHYPSVRQLLAGMKEQGPLFCENLKKCSNKNGAFTDARIGPALSRRIYKIFMGMNPDSLDV